MDERKQVQRRSLKYIRLAAYLASQPPSARTITLTVGEIEDLIGETLPRVARFPSWWHNDARRMHSRAWLTAGWTMTAMEASKGTVTFERSES